MKIAILSRDPTLYSTRRLAEAGRQLGHEVAVIDYLRCYMNITASQPQVVYQGHPLTGFDAVIPRIGASKTFYGAAVVRQFEMMDIFSANESQAIVRSRDKLRCLQLLSRDGIDLPITGFAHSTKDTEGLIGIVGGPPLVIKLVEGTQGSGVVLAENLQAARSVIEVFRDRNVNLLVQEFIKESSGVDVRAFVVGRRVVAAMRRQGPPGDFRSNLHRGGSATSTELTKEERKIAVGAARVMGLNVAGVDLLRSNRGPLVMEVNSSPGLEGIEKATGVDVASEVFRFIERRVTLGQGRDKIRA